MFKKRKKKTLTVKKRLCLSAVQITPPNCLNLYLFYTDPYSHLLYTLTHKPKRRQNSHLRMRYHYRQGYQFGQPPGPGEGGQISESVQGYQFGLLEEAKFQELYRVRYI